MVLILLPIISNIGLEFSYLFMSTVDRLDDTGNPFDSLKSFSNPYLFNTAFGRARSIVVVAGNPFTLIRAEDTMREPRDCWREFINVCQDQAVGKFIVPKKLQKVYDSVKQDLNRLIKKLPSGKFITFVQTIYYNYHVQMMYKLKILGHF